MGAAELADALDEAGAELLEAALESWARTQVETSAASMATGARLNLTIVYIEGGVGWEGAR